jgi:hypothetical protein
MRLTVCLTLVAFSLACSSGTGSGPAQCSTCSGCCATDGTCKDGTDVSACGTGGTSCNACVSPQVCMGTCMDPSPVDSGTPDSGTPDAGSGLRCDPTPTNCSDQAIQQLDLKTTVNSANTLIGNTTDGGSWDSTINATAGGVTPTMSFVYAKFTDSGLVGVALDDQSALDSPDWDIAFRRFIIRLNGGTSGPSCVDASAYPGATAFDAAMLPSATATYSTDQTFSPPPDCTFKDDGSGLTTSPSTALDNPSASFYTYTSCVKMSGKVFAVRTREGRVVKLVITGYYATDAAQQQCQMGTMPMVAGGHITAHWAFLQ